MATIEKPKNTVSNAVLVYAGQTARMRHRGYESTDAIVEDIDMEVWYCHDKGEDGDRDYPGSPATVNIEAVYIQQTDVVAILSRNVLDKLEKHCIAQCGY